MRVVASASALAVDSAGTVGAAAAAAVVPAICSVATADATLADTLLADVLGRMQTWQGRAGNAQKPAHLLQGAVSLESGLASGPVTVHLSFHIDTCVSKQSIAESVARCFCVASATTISRYTASRLGCRTKGCWATCSHQISIVNQSRTSSVRHKV